MTSVNHLASRTPTREHLGGGWHSLRFLGLVLAYFAVGMLSAWSAAQAVDPATAAQRPIPGIGHDYLGVGAEMVNPADGSVSFNLPFNTPPGRGLGFPFSIRYSSSDPFYLSNDGGTGTFYWLTPGASHQNSPFRQDGWSYALPHYTASASIVYTQSYNCSPSSPCSTYIYCWASQGYTFLDLEGASHTLDLGNSWIGPASANPYTTECENDGWAGYGGNYNGHSFNGITAAFTDASSVTEPAQPAILVTDKSGTKYTFPDISNSYVGPAYGSLAQTITDRNGNQMVFSGSNGPTTYAGLPAGSYLDASGRAIVGWSGLASSSGDQISISGLPSNIVVKWKQITVTPPTGSKVTSGSSCGLAGRSDTLTVVSEIDLPNKKAYLFSYGGTYGLLTRITFPDGGYVRYLWGPNTQAKVTYQQWPIDAPNNYGELTCYAAVDTPAVTDRYVSFDGSTETLHQHFTYSTTLNSQGWDWASKVTTVATTDSSTNLQTVVTYNYLPGNVNLGANDQPHAVQVPQSFPTYTDYLNWQSSTVPLESSIVTADNTGKVYQTVNKQWFDTFTLSGHQTILDNGQGETTLLCSSSADNITDVFEYDFQANGAKPADPSCVSSSGLNTSAIGPLLRHTATAFHTFQGTNILDRPDSETVTDGSGNKVSQMNYGYDANTVVASNATTGLQPVSASRANTTSASRWLNATGTSLTTNYTYFDTGQIQTRVDPCASTTCSDMASGSHTTTYSYQDSPSQSQQTSTYLTKITDALGHTQAFTYNYPSGRMASATDPNSQTTTFAYNDSLLRLTDVYAPASSQNNGMQPHTSYDYVDGPNSTMTTVGPTGITTVETRDGFDRVTNQNVSSAPGGSILTDTTYDGENNLRSVSNPYQATNSPSYGITSSLYDPLNRKTYQCQPDNSSSAATLCSPSNNYQSWRYSGSTTTVADEAGNNWQHTTDALGRLVKVVEPGGQQTSYTYDLLDNLLGVNQAGVSGETPRTRAFTYDSLSRLITSFNPETGYVCYGTVTSGQLPNGTNCTEGYDANGNLSTKTTSQPDANGNPMVLHYKYDVLNRLTNKTAPTDVDNLSATFVYDSATNGVGRVASENRNTVAGEAYTYDEMGRVVATTWIQYHKNNAVQGMQVTYDLAGQPTALTYPDGRVLGQHWDLAGHLASIGDQTSGGSGLSYLAAPSTPLNTFSAPSTEYWPSGDLANVSFGSAITAQYALNSRMQPTGAAAGSSFLGGSTGAANMFERQMAYLANVSSSGNCAATATHNNGNMYSVVDILNSGLTQTYSYDTLNRLTCAMRSDQVFSQSYKYDSFANMIPNNNLVNSTEQLNYSIDPATNRLLFNQNNFVYDNAGNLIQTPNSSGGSNTYTYTGEALLRCVNGCSTNSYIVDALGQRTYASRSGAATQYVYLNRQLMAEYNTSGYWADYIYANGKKIAKVESTDAPIHLSGTNCSNCGGSATYVLFTAGAGRVIQEGDSLNLSQYAVGTAEGGAIVYFTDGSWADGYTYDQDGQQINCDGIKNRWHQRHIDLSAFAGKTVQKTLLINDVCAGSGQFDIYFNDVAISGNGSVSTIYSPQHGATFTPVNSSQWPGKATGTAAIAQSDSSAPGSAAHFYLDDHLGTVEMELASGGWPTWLGQFTPFGQEIVNGAMTAMLGSQPADGTAMRYKFTGKERDAESGLDYFGARYYGSNMGRFMSPDPHSGTILHMLNPQRWNMYSYALNNPLTFTDPTGMDAVAVNFSGMVGGLGHEGILAITSDGTATYSRFGPATQTFGGGYGLSEPGQADITNLNVKVQFGSDGLPTADSYKALEGAVAGIEKAPASTVRLNYFKTSDTETALLKLWMQKQHNAAGRYKLCTRNCANFTVQGLLAGHALTQGQASNLSNHPNTLFQQLIPFAADSSPHYKVTSRIVPDSVKPVDQ